MVVVIALAVCSAPVLLVLSTGLAPIRGAVSAYLPHAPIRIDGDADFHATAVLEGWSGTGTLASPYIIYGYEFSGPSTTEAFYVGNSNVYFVLTGCFVHDYSIGIYLLTSSNARIENSTVERCEIGLVLMMTEATVFNNYIQDCTYAVFDLYSPAAQYLTNVFTSSFMGLCIAGADGSVVNDNMFQDNELGGLVLGDSQHMLLRNNVFLNDGITISGTTADLWDTHDIDTSNTVNGQAILYLADDVGSSIATDYGQVILANCTNTVLNGLDLENTTYGVLAGFCSGISVRTSTLRDNYIGMMMQYCDNSSLMSTYSVNNMIGIEIENSEFCYAAGVTFQSDGVGIGAWYAPDTTAIGNVIVSDETAIRVTNSLRARILTNTMSASGILIEGDMLEYWNTHNITTDNMVNGFPVIYLKDLIGDPVPMGAGQVILANCSQMQVSGSYIDRATAAFQLGYSSGCRVTTLSAWNCMYGIRLYECSGIQVDNADLDDDMAGIYVELSAMGTITTNWITNCTRAAILLVDSTEQSFNLNDMTNCGIIIASGTLDGWNTHSIPVSNFVNGQSVYYAKNALGMGVLGGYGQVILANCTGFTVAPQTIVNASIAVQLGFCSGVIVNNLTASENVIGLQMEQSSDCDIKGPWLTHNQYGIYMDGGIDNTVTSGLFYMNDAYAVYLSGMTEGNLVTGNTFQYNNGAGDVRDRAHVQAADNGVDNLWNTTAAGNYWQDWQTPDGNGDGIVDVPYDLDGYGSTMDHYPLTTPTQVIPELGLAQMLAVIAGTVAMLGYAARRRPPTH